jgi:integrase
MPSARWCGFLLLTGVRRTEAARMERTEVTGDEWIVPAERMKGGKEHLVPLTAQAARAIIDAMPKIGSGRFVFTSTGKGPFTNFAKAKRKLDEASGVTGWTLHDARRTARSLMSRDGVQSDHAERVRAHVIGRVRGTYDRHAYAAEKRFALEKLAVLIERNVRPPADDIVPLHAQA